MTTKQSLQVISPVDGSVYIHREYFNQHQIEQALNNGCQAQTQWAATPIEQRATLCLKAVDWMLQHAQDIAEEITWQMGRPLQYTPGELKGFAERARTMVEIAPNKLQDITVEQSPDFQRLIQRRPLGLVFAVVPWNYPLLTAVNALIPALMAGNTMIMKASSQTPLCGERLQEALNQAGVPEGVFQSVLLTHGDTEALVKHPKVDFLVFTGSVAGGQSLHQALGERFIGSTMELGGKDPAYVRADADLEFTVANLVDGAFFNSGQSCCGIERIYVHQELYEEFTQRFVALVKQYRLGNPLLPETTLGPVVNARAVQRVQTHIQQALQQGAQACIAPEDFPTDQPSGLYMPPQVLVNVNHAMDVMREETFGPVVGIMPVNSDAQAVELMNDSHYGLTASVWTQDDAAAFTLGQQVHTGTWFMNRCDYLDPALSWTGCKMSGTGCSLSEIAYEHLSRPKSFHLRKKIS
ncbi:MAG: aldehyde dehydrogenase family protein [Gammaproteobacteria bacterium]|nr:aldehyde dehydrogenase family protein [Gammaproteobacteria bacterium]MDH5803198.1 aldehyde dehydrogenase family protein [Gammaproteobacteria bacterium]